MSCCRSSVLRRMFALRWLACGLLLPMIGCQTLPEPTPAAGAVLPPAGRAVTIDVLPVKCVEQTADVPSDIPQCITSGPENRCRCCCRPDFTLREDLGTCLPVFRDDAIGAANWTNGLWLATALGGAIAIHQDLDDEVREEIARHPERWDEGTRVLGKFGEASYQIPVLLGVYAWSLQSDDPQLHDFSTTVLSAYALTGLMTVAIKGIADTERPSTEWNDGRYGFPSFHTASSFTVAAVVEEYYGLEAGLPAYALAGLIGWSRIDEQDHDLSDVVFGAAMGYVIGKSVVGRRLHGDSRLRLTPYLHPTDGTPGVSCEVPF